MNSQILLEMTIDMPVQRAPTKDRRPSLVSKQPLLVWRTFFTLTEQSSMVTRHEHCGFFPPKFPQRGDACIFVSDRQRIP
jgi:hypothetical protein